MFKRKVIQTLQQYLADELAALAPKASADAETGQRVAELHRQLLMFRLLPVRDFSGVGEVVCPAALVELDLNGLRAHYLIVPQGGGLVTKVDDRPVQVITPNSPLGEALMGHKTGDSVKVELGGKTREYRVISLS
ncbi:MAG: GreA/GreB family elongation factor [Oligoflexia bacterium]|nr:GreA/GreB family elongation factor [Oligoflexia bacterium]